MTFSREADARAFCDRTGAVLVPPANAGPARNPKRGAKLSERYERVAQRLIKAKYKAADAREIAAVHQRADEIGIVIEWDQDDIDSSDFEDGDETRPLWIVRAIDEETGETLDSMGGVDLGDVGPDAHHSAPYQWDAEAQVLREAMAGR